MLGNLIPFFFSGNSLQEYIAYYNRVLGDGGTLVDPVGTQSILKMLKDNARLDNVKLLWYGGAGVKKVISGINTNVSKAYSIQLPSNDLTQTTALSQPWQSGNIAPNEKPCLLNPNGGARFMQHPDISFGGTDAWSISFVITANGTSSTNNILFGNSLPTATGQIRLRTNGRVLSINDGAVKLFNTIPLTCGKVNICQLIADGTGKLTAYVNNASEQLTGVNTSIVFKYISSNSDGLFGKLHYYRIQSGAMSASQVAAEYNTLRALIPERESVTIGSQAWTTSNLDIVCDAQGVVIPEVTDNAAWAALTTPAWCHYNNDSANGAIYGKLYNWYAVKQIDDALAATGSEWRVPTQAQLNTLATTLGGASVAGGKMKVAGTNYWATPNTGADNSSGFTGLGCGNRSALGVMTNFNGSYPMGSITSVGGTFSTVATLSYNSTTLTLSDYGSKIAGYSIRLVKNL